MRILCFFSLALPLLAAGSPQFAEHSIATDLRGGYQVVSADLNGDGKPDLIALGSGMSDLVWYENPTWQRHVLASGFTQLINCAVIPAAPGAIPDILVASGFAQVPAQSPGKVALLRHNADPRGPWTLQEIDQLTTSHRLRIADIDGSGKPVVIDQPLVGPKATPPDFRDQTPMVYYRPGEWKRQFISDGNSGVVHCIYPFDWDGDGRDEILTASFVGIDLFKLGKDGKWTRTELAKGDPSPWPKSGASDVAVGKLGATRFLTSIEPWHGNQVVTYTQKDGQWARHVIDSSFQDGHALLTADLDRDGRDEIVGGFRGRGRSVYIYTADDATGENWTRTTLDDGGMGAASCLAADLNGDGRLDIACIDSTRLKWYENQGASPAATQPK
ncbi:MAG TPA: FG-GAP-like repeat-containing protein [Bryobacteraceae bacterium]|nr:FG-GAP-like repeat-containing protein [Bryobacteraceae bacterium]